MAHPEIVAELAAGGAQWIQLREKRLSDAELFLQAGRAVRAVPAGVRLIVNDRSDIALACKAAGVHLGEGDLSPAAVRTLPGADRLVVGFSTHSAEQAIAAAEDDAVDYVAIGPIFQSQTKNVRPPLGIGVISRIRAQTGKPLVAIGGIDETNIRAVIEAGADSAAVIAALYRGGTIRANVERLLGAARIGR
jgi:thiamine-phosphate pyrophosphorylase